MLEEPHTCDHSGCRRYAPFGFNVGGRRRLYCIDHRAEGVRWHQQMRGQDVPDARQKALAAAETVRQGGG